MALLFVARYESIDGASIILNVKTFAWAKDDVWASHVIKRDGKFYWYVAVSHGNIHGKAISVAVTDNPLGPFKDAIGKAVVTNDITTETKISWDDVDPTVIVDNGQAYLFWGNTKLYWVKLKENMIEMDGAINTINLSHYNEAPGGTNGPAGIICPMLTTFRRRWFMSCDGTLKGRGNTKACWEKFRATRTQPTKPSLTSSTRAISFTTTVHWYQIPEAFTGLCA